MKTNQTLKNWVIGEMIDKLDEMKGYNESVYMSDLAYRLFESENVNGSYYCSTYKAQQWIKKYWDYLGDQVESYESNFGESIKWNPFNNAECFMVVIILEMASSLMYQIDLSETYDDQLVLTNKVINKIIRELKELKD